MRLLKPVLLYFAIVFGAGFIPGPIRLAWAVPRFGVRAAELMETPVMLAVIVLAARWVMRRLAVPPAPATRLAMGLIALALLLVAEFGPVLWLRGMTIGEYLATRDPVSGTVYYVALAVMGVMPLLVGRKPTQ